MESAKRRLAMLTGAMGGQGAGRRFFVGGNFKSNGTVEQIKNIIETLNKATLKENVEVVIAPPALYLLLARELIRPDIKVAAQNIFDKGPGAYTGEIAAQQLKDAGIDWVILGHSERRSIFGESDQFVASKTKAALDAGLSVILCCGESLEEREKGITTQVVTRQLGAVADLVQDWTNIVVAYEPVWAIGTGKVATTEQAQETHAEIRKWLEAAVSPEAAVKTRILYGGSVTEKNSAELAKQPDVDGFLVGGASLKPAFIDIINSAP
ncbi:Triosephosphate isomerase [Sphaerosporella brunnea]|uniref:Triosephosphate isomerase n=1 Tax=Sphaerosporella brunnea TaxID=1250544 RepID=A0A5J5EUF7_9PEZI|nr:Triosephosphate isomerase [Sphaerosporella brunnea]